MTVSQVDPGGVARTELGQQSRSALFVLASSAIAALVAFASLLGLLTAWPYEHETENWMLQARGQDIGNLLAVVVLVASAIRLRSGSSRAAALSTRTLLYLLYAYIVYAFAVHFSRLFLVYIAVLGLVVYTLIGALRTGTLRAPDGHDPARRVAAWALIGTGALFGLLWLSELVPATVTGEAPQSLEVAGLIVNPIHAIDLAAVLPGMITVGALTLRADRTGRSLAVPALVFSVLMGSSIVAAMVLIVASGDASGVVPMVAGRRCRHGELRGGDRLRTRAGGRARRAGITRAGQDGVTPTLRPLLTVCDRRSIAGSDAVVRLVLAAPERVTELVALAADDDQLVSMRALDALEKVARARPPLVQPHREILLGPLADSERWEIRLQIARTLPELTGPRKSSAA
jgi:uncharacterized Tic20 family protein